jgi:hypothetical protein
VVLMIGMELFYEDLKCYVGANADSFQGVHSVNGFGLRRGDGA